MHLTAGVMPQVVPVDLEHALIVHVHQLMYESVFHVSLIPEPTLTEYRDTGVGHEPSRAVVVARLATQVLGNDRAPGLFKPFQHEYHDWA